MYSHILHQNMSSCDCNLPLLLKILQWQIQTFLILWIISNYKWCRVQGLFFGVPNPTPCSGSPWQWLRWKHRGKTKGNHQSKNLNRFEHFQVGNLLITSTNLSRGCEILQRPLRAQKPWKRRDSWEAADQEMQENIIAKCKIFSKSCQLTCKILHLMVSS